MDTHDSEIVERALTERPRYDGTYEEWLEEWDYAVTLMESGDVEDAWALGSYLVRSAHDDWSYAPVFPKLRPFTEFGIENNLLVGD